MRTAGNFMNTFVKGFCWMMVEYHHGNLCLLGYEILITTRPNVVRLAARKFKTN